MTPRNSVLSIPDLVAELKHRGIQTKNLYNAVYTTLKREVQRGNKVRYEQGVGFFRCNGEAPLNTLVATCGPEGTVLEKSDE